MTFLIRPKRLSRRTLLRGAATGAVASLALPPLEAMFGPRAASANVEGLPPMFGMFYWANGMPWHAGHGTIQAEGGHPDLWTPAQTGAGYTPSEMLAPLAPYLPSVATGLEPKTDIPTTPPGQGDGHMRGFMVATTGDRIRPEGFDHPSHTLTALRPTIDQYVAKHDDYYGDAIPRFRSLQIGISEARFHDYGHWNAVSYNGPDSLNLPISSPGQLYDLLFAVPDDAGSLQRRASLLDAVMDDAAELRAKLGNNDKQRLDAHLAHLDEIQRRLLLSAAPCEAPPVPADSGDLHVKCGIMADLLATALSCELTRVFSFMLTSPATTHVFSNLGVPDGMHKTCHDGHWDRVRAITLHQMEAFAILLDRLATTLDPMGNSLLDNGLVYGTSEYGEGWKHGTKELPAVFVGGACGAVNRGVHTREPDGNFSKVHVTTLRALGIETDTFGFNGGETSDHITGILA